MPVTEIIFTSIEAIRLLMNAMEAANAGNKEEALEYLEAVKIRVGKAEAAWEDSKA